MSESSVPTKLSSQLLEREALCECGRLFFSRGWSVGTSSNYSCVSQRDPLQLWVTVSGKDKGRLTTDDFVLVNASGEPVRADSPRSSAETMLHTVAAAHPRISAVLHTHSIWSTLLSDLYYEQRGFEIAGYEMLKGLSGVTTHEHQEWVDIYDNTQDIPVLAEQVKQRMQDTSLPPMHGYLIRRHGLYTWGESIEEARRHVEIFEFLFECVARRLMLSSAPPV